MKVKVKRNNRIIDVEPYYLNGRVVCYLEHTKVGDVSWLLNEVIDENSPVFQKEYYGN